MSKIEFLMMGIFSISVAFFTSCINDSQNEKKMVPVFRHKSYTDISLFSGDSTVTFQKSIMVDRTYEYGIAEDSIPLIKAAYLYTQNISGFLSSYHKESKDIVMRYPFVLLDREDSLLGSASDGGLEFKLNNNLYYLQLGQSIVSEVTWFDTASGNKYIDTCSPGSATPPANCVTDSLVVGVRKWVQKDTIDYLLDCDLDSIHNVVPIIRPL